MTRALPPATPTRTRRRMPTPPWARARVTEASPVRTATVVVGPREYANLVTNPNATILREHLVGPRAVKVVVRYTDRTASTLQSRPPIVRFTGVGRWARAMAVLIVVPAAAYALGWAVWHYFGDAITHGLFLLAEGLGAVGVAAVIFWFLSSKAGICPGYHCPGCPHNR